MKRYNFWLLTDYTERLRSLADKQGVSMSELVRQAIESFLARTESAK